MILAGTNNYLGLTFNHDAISEGQAALAAQGTGTTGSRIINGSYAPHLAGVEHRFIAGLRGRGTKNGEGDA